MKVPAIRLKTNLTALAASCKIGKPFDQSLRYLDQPVEAARGCRAAHEYQPEVIRPEKVGLIYKNFETSYNYTKIGTLCIFTKFTNLLKL